MNQIMQKAPLSVFGDGLQTRAVSYVGDIVPAMARCVTMEATKSQVFNVSGDHVYLVKELAETLLKLAKVTVPLNHLPARNEVKDAYSDHSKFQKVFGGQRETTLEEGLQKMWVWAQERGVTSTSKFGAIEIEKSLPPSWRV